MEEQAVVNNPVQQPSIQTPQGPKHNSFLTNKLFLITLAIVVLFTIVYAGIYLYLGSQLDKISKPNQTAITTQPSPTPNPTANWKIYVDKEHEFKFEYPSFLSVSEQNLKKENAPSIKQIGFYNPNNTEKFDENAINMNILRYDISRAKDSEDLINGFSEDAGGNKLKRSVIEKEIIVGDKKASEFTINYSYAESQTQEPVLLEYQILIPLKQKTLSIHLYTANNKAKKTVDEVILPTFKFLPASPSASQSGDQE